MKKLYILIALLLAASTQAAVTNVFTDDFTGSDGTTVTNTNWGYLDGGIDLTFSSTDPLSVRAAPADVFEIQGNALYAEVKPIEATTNTVYNKLLASIYPKTNGSPVSATIAAGEKIVFETDLTAYVNNDGRKWGNSQQVKLVLSGGNTYADPHKAPAETNSALIVVIRPTIYPYWISIQGAHNIAATQTATANMNFPTNSPVVLPLILKVEHYYNTGTTAYWVNGALIDILFGTTMPTVQPYLWFGKFNGEGTEITEGSMTLDNVDVSIAADELSSAPDAATDFAAVSTVSGTIDLSWTDVATNELGYRLERKIAANPDSTYHLRSSLLAPGTTSYTDNGEVVDKPAQAHYLLTNGTVYAYRLKAINCAGESAGVVASSTAVATVPVDLFADWATANYPVLSGSKANTEDYDNDGASDYREYALNGNPTNGADTGMVEATNDGTTFTYVYAKRTDDTSISYTLVDTIDLVDGPNSTDNWDSQTSGPSGVANFDSVTNNYNMIGNPLFIKLIIE